MNTDGLFQRKQAKDDNASVISISPNQLDWCVIGSVAIVFLACCGLLCTLCMFPWIAVTCSAVLESVPENIVDFVPDTISFGSCMGNWMGLSLLDHIKTDAHVFLGDNVYFDDYIWELQVNYPLTYKYFGQYISPNIMPYMAMVYRKLSCDAHFKALMRRIPYVMATWDDHDFGMDNCDGSFPYKLKTREMFIDFWKLNPSRKKPNAGIYGMYFFRNVSHSVLVVIPDLFYYKSDTQLLGIDQWGWIRSYVQPLANEADFIILAMSSAVKTLVITHRTEMFGLLNVFPVGKSIVVSGDLHHPYIEHLITGHIEVITSPLSESGSQPRRAAQMCLQNQTSCTVDGNDDNYAVIDIWKRKASVFVAEGPIMEVLF